LETIGRFEFEIRVCRLRHIELCGVKRCYTLLREDEVALLQHKLLLVVCFAHVGGLRNAGVRAVVHFEKSLILDFLQVCIDRFTEQSVGVLVVEH